MAGFQLQFIDEIEDVPFRVGKSREIFDHWQSLRGDGPVPRAEDINPGSMKRLLPEIFIFELPDDGSVRYRLAGTQAVMRLGFEPKGMNLLDMTPPDTRPYVLGAFQLVAHHHVGGLAHFSSSSETRKNYGLELVLLPIIAPDGQPPRILSLSTRLEPDDVLPDEGRTESFADEVENAIIFDLGLGIPSVLRGVAQD
ncbi:MAG: PAS domain-containing protein [Parvibaculum sp.]|nr:PAS domain-containing protein [Parvibaculum sp.]